MDKLKNIKPEPKAIIQNLYAWLITLAIEHRNELAKLLIAAGATIPTYLSGFDPVGLVMELNPAIKFLLYFLVYAAIIFAIWGLYNRLQRKSNQLEKANKKQVEPKPVASLSVGAYNGDAFQGRVGIKITANPANKIIGLRVELAHNGLVERNAVTGDKIIQVPSDGMVFSCGNRKDTTTIADDDPLIIYIAEVTEQNLVLFKSDKPFFIYDFAVHLLDADISLAIKESKSIDPISFKGHIHYEAEIPWKYDQSSHNYIEGKPMSISITEIPNG